MSKKQLLMKRLIPALLLISFLFQVSCSDEDIISNINETDLVNGLMEFNVLVVVAEIDKVTGDLQPGSNGHLSNLETLSSRIEQSAEAIKVTDFCNDCHHSLYTESLLYLEVDSLGTKVSRTLHLLGPENEALQCLTVTDL